MQQKRRNTKFVSTKSGRVTKAEVRHATKQVIRRYRAALIQLGKE